MDESVFNCFYGAANAKKAAPMAAYLKGRFPFLGINKPERALLIKEFLKERKKDRAVDWDFVALCYEKKEREFHYLALAYLGAVKKLFTASDIYRLEKLIVTNSWWDSVDSAASLVGELVLGFPETEAAILDWAASTNIWLKRAAIIFQLKYKNKTKQELLAKIILQNRETGEFFVDKAIGWALREYSKTDKEWVRDFINKHSLSKLSVREGGKYL